jgi:Tfp pilus assembly protein PilW
MIPSSKKCALLFDDPGFVLVEFLVAAALTLIISTGIYGVLAEIQRWTSYQREVQDVSFNARSALETVERILRQAGNNPHNISMTGITIGDSTYVHIQSDLTGSLSPGQPDKGDPDGDVDDSGEDVSVRYNAAARTLELVSGAGSAQPFANYISALSFQYYDAADAVTGVGADVRRISVYISAATTLLHPQTHNAFGISLTASVQISN